MKTFSMTQDLQNFDEFISVLGCYDPFTMPHQHLIFIIKEMYFYKIRIFGELHKKESDSDW